MPKNPRLAPEGESLSPAEPTAAVSRLRKFIWAAVPALLIWCIFLVSFRGVTFLYGLALFSFSVGVTAALIPLKKKIYYIPVSILIGFITTVVIEALFFVLFKSS